MKKLLLLAALGLGLGLHAPTAHAQTAANCGVNYVPAIGVNCANVREATYIATLNGLVPAASATDFLCIAGAAGKSIHIREISISGTAGTLITTPIFIRRITGTLNTGTASTAILGPRAMSPGNPLVAATVVGYDSTGGNPTVTGTTAGFTSNELTLGVTGTTAAPADKLVWRFGTALDAYSQGLDITGSNAATTEYCLNLGAISVSSGKLYGDIIWTEN